MRDWTTEERKLARQIAEAVYGSAYRNLAVLKRLACLAAARRIVQVETNFGLHFED